MGFMYKYAMLLFATGSWGLITSTIEANIDSCCMVKIYQFLFHFDGLWYYNSAFCKSSSAATWTIDILRVSVSNHENKRVSKHHNIKMMSCVM